jgi:hypothetical protein
VRRIDARSRILDDQSPGRLDLQALRRSAYGSGAGLPRATSSALTITGGIARPTRAISASAKLRGHDVTIAQRSPPSAASVSRAPSIAAPSSVTSVPKRSKQMPA